MYNVTFFILLFYMIRQLLHNDENIAFVEKNKETY